MNPGRSKKDYAKQAASPGFPTPTECPTCKYDDNLPIDFIPREFIRSEDNWCCECPMAWNGQDPRSECDDMDSYHRKWKQAQKNEWDKRPLRERSSKVYALEIYKIALRIKVKDGE